MQMMRPSRFLANGLQSRIEMTKPEGPSPKERPKAQLLFFGNWRAGIAQSLPPAGAPAKNGYFA